MEYPNTRIEDVIDSQAGVEFPDPYRWLEGDSDEVRKWQRDQGQLAADYVREWPHFDALRKSVERHWTPRFTSLPRFAGGKWFRSETPEGATQAKAIVSDSPFGDGRALYDPQDENPDNPPYLSWLSPSPDGRIVAIGVCADASEMNSIRLIDVETTELLPNPPPQMLLDAWTGGASWLPDSTGFHFLSFLEVIFHSMTDGSQRTAEIPFPDPDVQDYTLIAASSDGRYLIAHHGLMRPSPIAILDLTESNPSWRPFITDIEETVAGHVVGGRLIAVTEVDGPRGRIVAIPLDTPTPNNPSTWTELVAESEAVIRTVTPVGNLLYTTEFVDTYARARIFDQKGDTLGEVPLPGKGAIMEMPFPLMNLGGAGNPDGFMFAYSSLTESAGVYRHRLGQEGLEIVKKPVVILKNAVVEDKWATSADGVKIPYHTVRLAEVDYSEPRPVLIYAYGGFNAPWVPSYPGAMAAFIAAGGVFVHGHLRGGAEFGLEWWEGGRMENKQNCYKDLYAIAEDLIDDGVTAKDLLAVTGGSNGGLMSGVAITQRPNLWKAVVPQVPLMDIIGSMRDIYGYLANKNEFGNPEDPEAIRRIAGFSPYHLVKDGEKYPPVFITAGDTDPRCPPWHSRKFAARLQAANASENPILVHIWERSGHGWATDKDTQITQTTEWLAFVMRHLKMTP